MNILNIISSVNQASGGPIEGITQLGRTLLSAGHQVEIASLDRPDAFFLKQCPLLVYPLGPPVSRYAFSPRFIPWLQANRGRYDAVIVNGIWQFHSYGTWRALRNSNTPYVLFTHGMLDPWFKKRYPLKHLKKWMYWPWAEYRVLRDAKAVLFTSEEERTLARLSFWLYRCNETVVGLGTARPGGNSELELHEFLSNYPALRGKKLALFLGRIHPKKGCDLLIDAFAKVLGPQSSWHLVIAGPDQVGWQKYLKLRAGQLGVSSRITWTGLLSGTLKQGALRAADVFVLPSHQENFGVAVTEALACGLPVLISKKVNIWREVEQNGAGFVASDDFEGTCQLFESWNDLSRAGCAAASAKAKRCFETYFEITIAARRMLNVLEQVVANQGASFAGRSAEAPIA